MLTPAMRSIVRGAEFEEVLEFEFEEGELDAASDALAFVFSGGPTMIAPLRGRPGSRVVPLLVVRSAVSRAAPRAPLHLRTRLRCSLSPVLDLVAASRSVLLRSQI